MSSFHIVALVIHILVSLNFLWYLALYFPFFFSFRFFCFVIVSPKMEGRKGKSYILILMVRMK